MKSISFLYLFFSAFLYPQTFHSLHGIENQQGETELLYRLGSDYFPYNPVMKFNTATLAEQVLMHAFHLYPPNELARGVHDFEFFPGDPDNFVNAGDYINPDNYGFIARNDSDVFIETFESLQFVDISKQDPLKVFVFPGMIRSWDGGYTFPIDSIPATVNFSPVSMADFDDKTFFGFNEDGDFCKNGSIVDTSRVFVDRYFKMLYDQDGQHVYRVNKTYWIYSLNVSNDRGGPFTWTRTFESFNPLYITSDSLTPGTLYMSENNLIWKSTDHGYNFSFYNSLPYRIHGIYKKPGSEILYAATPYRIYKITPDSITVAKSLPVPKELADYYPLKTGNKWIFDEYTVVYGWPIEYYHYIRTKQVLGDSTAVNGKTYKVIRDETTFEDLFILERIDTTEGKIYRFTEDWVLPGMEYLIEDLSAMPGDTIYSHRLGYSPGGITVFLAEDYFNKWGLTSPKKIYVQNNLFYPYYSLTKNIGLDSLSYSFDFGNTDIILKGCIIDGMIYGDTTTTAVNDYNGLTPDRFMLYQNYPNPFNPATTIKYCLTGRQYVSLIVFDILGNKILSLVNEEKPAGTYEIKFDGSTLPSGVYIYKLRAGDFLQSRKMLLLK